MGAPLEDGFAVDTGCDFDLILAARLRDRLREGGLRPTRASILWGRPVIAERYRVHVWMGKVWTAADAYYPVMPRADENLVGLPLLRFETVCIRPALRETWVGRAPG